jgi:exo-beta-1,3-glucanase (GH17 family)
VRVTSCFSGTVLCDDPTWAPAVDACEDVVYLTVYPWYGNAAPGNIKPQMDWSYANGLQQVIALGKKIVIAEIGWPSAGSRQGSQPATVENEKINFATTKEFLSGPGWDVDTYWFEMFDEWWKTKEGDWGPHWGLYTGGANPAPKW